ncbi:DMT family transporter [Aestuariivita boseongensis]|uniref:DMT family transporter n=1 Tax=Aestuariivita boseongensis TaxID=1470562 RepID=UPI00068181E2|nr:DMT family transporter [Aestuariivita boseongensis]
MSITGLALVLAAAVCHATWNFYVKRINGGPELIWLFSVVAVLLYLPLAVWIVVTQKPDFSFWPMVFIIGTIVLHLGYFLLLQTGYRHGDLSLVYPVARSTGPLLSTGFAVLFLGEVITLQMAAGALLIIFGVLMLTGGIRFGARQIGASLAFGLGAGLFIGSYTAWDTYAVSVLLVPPLLLDYASNLGRVVVLAPIALKRRSLVVQHWTHHRTGVLIIAVLSPLAYILVLYALTFTPVAFVAPTREVSVLLTVLAGSLLLGEGQLRQRLGWAVVIFAGMSILVTA